MDLFTDHIHDSELQTITTPSLITTAPSKPFPACCIFISRSLAAASNSDDSSASRAQVLSSQPPCAEHSSQLATKWVASIVFKITPRHGPHRKHPVSIVVSCLATGCITISNRYSFVVGACLPRCCIATAVVSLFVSRCLHHNMNLLSALHLLPPR
jgi:hypothetical protein